MKCEIIRSLSLFQNVKQKCRFTGQLLCRDSWRHMFNEHAFGVNNI